MFWVLGAVLAFPMSQARADEKVIPVGIEVDDAAFGNGDGSLEPGERATLKILLFNDGDTTASSVTGTLASDGANPFLQILDGFASWPDLIPSSPPQVSDPAHLEIMLAPAAACGAEVRLLLDIQTAAGSAQHLLRIPAGRREDRDAIQDALRRFDEPETTFWGSDGALGVSAATGDINGDGYDDIIVTAPYAANPHGVDAGYAYVVYGANDRLATADFSSPPAAVTRISGAEGGSGQIIFGDELGWGAATGDVNGDGYDDILLSSCADSVANSRPQAGEYYLIYGGAAPLPDIDLAAPPVNVVRFYGAQSGDARSVADPFEACLAPVASGDLNGDGFDDVILGAGHLGRRVYVVYGAGTALSDIDLASPPAGVSTIMRGAAVAIGWRVAAGDLDGDGYDDLVTTWSTTATVVFGRATQLGSVNLDTPPAGVVFLVNNPPQYGLFDFDAFGNLHIADLDADGFEDLLLADEGSRSIGDTRSRAGEYFLVYGKGSGWSGFDFQSPPPGVVRLHGADPNDGRGIFGMNASSGDLDGDGWTDLILTTALADSKENLREAAGEAYVLYGNGQRWSDIDLASPPPGAIRIWGGEPQDVLGYAVATGDTDGDGLDDLVLSSPSGASVDNSRPGAGEVLLWNGKPRRTYLARAQGGVPIPLHAASAQVLPLDCDDCSVAAALPFQFSFYGESFDTIYVSSNGFLSFAPIDDPASPVASCPGSATNQKLVVAPLWTDLNPSANGGSGSIWLDVQGTPPFRRAVVQWVDVPHYPAVGGASFTAILYESTGEILFSYHDLDFGDPNHDAGASAVSGLINRTGAQGSAYSCFTNDLIGTTIPAVQFLPATSLIEEHGEHGWGLWAADGLWHADTSCAPSAHSGASSLYFGDSSTCTDGGVSSGELFFPAIPAFPADGRVGTWYRDGLDNSTDAAQLRFSTTGTGGPWTAQYFYDDSLMEWRPGEAQRLFPSYAGADLNMEYLYASGASVNDALGFMVDDIQVTGCNAVGAGGPDDVLAVAYASPPFSYCEGAKSSVLDAVGSICGDLGSPVSYEWFENQAFLSSAPLWIIPPSKPAGTYQYDLAVHCFSGATAGTGPIVYTILDQPGPVDDSLDVIGDATSLTFMWNGIPGAVDYGIFQDSAPGGSFATLAGTSSGTTTLNLPTPAGNDVYFLVAASNACGFGPATGLPAVCGNGIVEPPEECDDGNTTQGDGCSDTCTLEAICGNGIVEPPEECDDGNISPGDGCSESCMIE